MKLELERSAFLKAWQVAEKYTASKTTLDALNGIRITAENDTVTLEATDLKSSVKCRAEGALVVEPGVAVLNASIAGTIIKKAKADTITLDVTSEKGTIIAGKSRSRFAVISSETFPNIPSSSGAEEFCSLQAMDLGRLIPEGICAASAPQDFPKYMGTCLLRTSEGKLNVVSTDGKRLALAKIPCAVSKEDDILLPSAATKELAKVFNTEDIVRILADGSTVWFVLDNAEFSVRRIEASFPKYERILNDNVKTSMKIAKQEFLSAIERVDVIAKNNMAHVVAMDLTPKVEETNPETGETVVVQPGELKIFARAPELGTSSEIVEADIEHDVMRIGYNLNFLQDGLKGMNSDNVIVEFSGIEEQTRLYKCDAEGKKSDDFLYMVMPIRLTPQDIVDDDEAETFTPQVPEELPEDDGQSFESAEPNPDGDSYGTSDSYGGGEEAPF